jgi:hypothetical protein
MSKRHSFSKAERALITERAQRTCEYCSALQDYSPDSFEAEHIQNHKKEKKSQNTFICKKKELPLRKILKK